MYGSSVFLIKSLTHKLVEQVGGVQSAAIYCGTTAAMISQYCNPNNKHSITVKCAIVLTNVTQDASLLNHIMNECKIQKQIVNRENTQELLTSLSLLNKETAELNAVYLNALSDNIIKKSEARLIVKEIQDVEEHLAGIKQVMSSVWEGEETQEKEFPHDTDQ